MRKKLAAGNWKMNGTQAALSELRALAQAHPDPDCDVVICPPATLISQASDMAGPINIGGQTCHTEKAGAHTGDISAAMLRDAGATHVILGHSERREDHREQNDHIRAQTLAVWEAGLIAIVCVGESLQQREADQTLDIIATQLEGSIPADATQHNLVVAYEPIWAIGTGKIPTLDQIGDVHDFMRDRLLRRFGNDVGRSVRLLYGGSVKPANADAIFGVPNVDGALVGGASLKAQDFSPIIAALETAK